MSLKIQEQLEQAGTPVKLLANSKQPAQQGWAKTRSSWQDIAQWQEHNIGLRPRKRFVVVDIDRHDAQARKLLDSLPNTFAVASPKAASIGELCGHYYFKLPKGRYDIPSKLAGIGDTVNAYRGQVVIPPSSIDGTKYEVSHNLPIAVLKRKHLAILGIKQASRDKLSTAPKQGLDKQAFSLASKVEALTGQPWAYVSQHELKGACPRCHIVHEVPYGDQTDRLRINRSTGRAYVACRQCCTEGAELRDWIVHEEFKRRLDNSAQAREGLDALSAFDAHAQTVTLDQTPVLAALSRDDGHPLMYADKTNCLYGQPGTGKSWLALLSAKQVLDRGARVLWVDEEDAPTTLGLRADTLGYLDDIVDKDKFRFVNSSLYEQDKALEGAVAWLQAGDSVGFVVIDSADATGAPSTGDDITKWWNKIVKPFAQAELGVLVLDHTAKHNQEGAHNDTPIGSTHKMSKLSGVALCVKGLAWDKENEGSVDLVVGKDRHSAVGGKNRTVAVVSGRYSNYKLELSLNDPEGRVVSPEDKVLAAFEQLHAEGTVELSPTQLQEEAYTRKNITYKDAKTAIARLEHSRRIIASKAVGRKGKVLRLARTHGKAKIEPHRSPSVSKKKGKGDA